MGNIAPVTVFMGKQARDKVPIKPAKTGQSTVDSTPKKPKKRVSSPLATYAGR